MRIAGPISVLVVGVLGTLATLTAPAASASLEPSTLYVDQYVTCSDTGPGSLALPFCSIQGAANVVDPGQTVDIETIDGGEPYDAFTMARSGIATAPIRFVGIPSVNGKLPVLDQDAYPNPIITLDHIQYVDVSSLSMTVPSGENGVEVTGSSNVVIDRMNLALQGDPGNQTVGIDVSGTSSDVMVSRAQISGAGSDGISVDKGARDVAVTTNFIDMNYQTGVSVSDGVDTDVTSNSVYVTCGTGISLTGDSSATVENNAVLMAVDDCSTIDTGLTVSADSASGVDADYDSVYVPSGDLEYSWSGATYETAAAFYAATGQGEHDSDLSVDDLGSPLPNGSQLIDSANCYAPGELSTDYQGSPRIADPLSSNTGNGACHADRGAVQQQDFMYDPIWTSSSMEATAPLTITLNVSSSWPQSYWHETYSVTVSFGDGSDPVTATPGAEITHTYSSPGAYELTTTETDTSGSSQISFSEVVAATTKPAKIAASAGPLIVQTSYGPAIELVSAAIGISEGSDAWEFTPSTLRTWTTFWHPGTYPVTVSETDVLGRVSTAKTSVTVGVGFTPVGPYTGFDKTIPAHSVVKLSDEAIDAAGQYGAFVNVAVSNEAKSGSLDVYPNGRARPADATLSFRAGQTTATNTLATFALGGADFYNNSGGPIRLTITTFGSEGPTASLLADTYEPAGPVQVLNTTKISGDSHAAIMISGAHGVPADAAAAVLDITASNTKATGYLTAYPQGKTDPDVVDAAWTAGQEVTDQVVVPLKDGKVVLQNSSRGAASFAVDLVGYYDTYGTAAVFLPGSDVRLLKVRVAPHAVVKLHLDGASGLPSSGVSAALVNLTASGALAGGWVTAYPNGPVRPNTASLSYLPGTTESNAATVPVGRGGDTDFYNNGSKPIIITVDLIGAYYTYPSLLP
jgi:hypothetical protein